MPAVGGSIARAPAREVRERLRGPHPLGVHGLALIGHRRLAGRQRGDEEARVVAARRTRAA